MNLRAIIASALTPVGGGLGVRRYDAGTEQIAERQIEPTPIPQRRQAPKSSEYAASFSPFEVPSSGSPVGPRDKVRYVVEPADLGQIPGRRLFMANTLIGLTFAAPKGSRRRALEAQAGYRMESRPRYTKVNRYPRPSRAPGIYGRS